MTRACTLLAVTATIVWERGKFANPPARNLQTWFAARGSVGAATCKFLRSGLYAYVNDNLVEAAELGTIAYVKVEGECDNDLMKQVVAPARIDGK